MSSKLDKTMSPDDFLAAALVHHFIIFSCFFPVSNIYTHVGLVGVLSMFCQVSYHQQSSLPRCIVKSLHFMPFLFAYSLQGPAIRLSGTSGFFTDQARLHVLYMFCAVAFGLEDVQCGMYIMLRFDFACGATQEFSFQVKCIRHVSIPLSIGIGTVYG